MTAAHDNLATINTDNIGQDLEGLEPAASEGSGEGSGEGSDEGSGEGSGTPEPISNPQAGEAPMAERRDLGDGANFKRSIYALPVNVQVVIGTANATISELLKLETGTVLEIDKRIDAPVDLCVDNRIIARGELIEIDPDEGVIGLRVIEIVDISEDLLT